MSGVCTASASLVGKPQLTEQPVQAGRHAPSSRHNGSRNPCRCPVGRNHAASGTGARSARQQPLARLCERRRAQASPATPPPMMIVSYMGVAIDANLATRAYRHRTRLWGKGNQTPLPIEPPTFCLYSVSGLPPSIACCLIPARNIFGQREVPIILSIPQDPCSVVREARPPSGRTPAYGRRRNPR